MVLLSRALFGLSVFALNGSALASECFDGISPARIDRMVIDLRAASAIGSASFSEAMQDAQRRERFDRAELNGLIRAEDSEALEAELHRRATRVHFFRFRRAAVSAVSESEPGSDDYREARRALRATAFLLGPFQCHAEERAERRRRRQERHQARAAQSENCHELITDAELDRILNSDVCLLGQELPFRFRTLAWARAGFATPEAIEAEVARERPENEERVVEPARIANDHQEVCYRGELAQRHWLTRPSRSRANQLLDRKAASAIRLRRVLIPVRSEHAEAEEFVSASFPLIEYEACRRRERAAATSPSVSSETASASGAASEEDALEEESDAAPSDERPAKGGEAPGASAEASVEATAPIDLASFVQDVRTCQAVELPNDARLAQMIDSLERWREFENSARGDETDRGVATTLRALADPANESVFNSDAYVTTEIHSGAPDTGMSCRWLRSQTGRLSTAHATSLARCYVEHRSGALSQLRSAAARRRRVSDAADRFYRLSRLPLQTASCSIIQRQAAQFCADHQSASPGPASSLVGHPIDRLQSMIAEIQRAEAGTERVIQVSEAREAIPQICRESTVTRDSEAEEDSAVETREESEEPSSVGTGYRAERLT